MAYNPFNMLLDLVCLDFVEDFCNYQLPELPSKATEILVLLILFSSVSVQMTLLAITSFDIYC